MSAARQCPPARSAPSARTGPCRHRLPRKPTSPPPKRPNPQNAPSPPLLLRCSRSGRPRSNTSVCVVDDVGKVLCERKVRTEPEDIAVLLTSIGGEGGTRQPFAEQRCLGCPRHHRSR